MLVRIIIDHVGTFYDLTQLLTSALYTGSDADWIINNGFDKKLDSMRALVADANSAISDLEQKEQQATGISSLKIRYNNVQGYYIEITNTHRDTVPERYKRVQTLVGRERFMTTELQDLQYGIERARKDIVEHEQSIFESIKAQVEQNISLLRKSAHALAHLDALMSLARLSYENGYVRPVFNDDRNIIIKNGRHPVVEQSLASCFIPNDTVLTDEQSLWIITGPNMGGKSTYLRQVALICVMAHMGSFVSAEKAEIPLLDRIFTRLGASDNVAEGKSTFLVEMEETATICTQSTEKSLVILDEVGRGTSTFDGLAIAQAVVEHLFNNIGARCLFATHYHELIHLKDIFSGVAVYYAASKKTSAGILFLYKMVQGVADGSFGIEVARLASLPGGVIKRATQLVDQFSRGDNDIYLPAVKNASNDVVGAEYAHLKGENERLLQELDRASGLIKRLDGVDLNSLSPRQAFDLLWELKNE